MLYVYISTTHVLYAYLIIESSVAPSVQAAFENLKMAKISDCISAHLTQRPPFEALKMGSTSQDPATEGNLKPCAKARKS